MAVFNFNPKTIYSKKGMVIYQMEVDEDQDQNAEDEGNGQGRFVEHVQVGPFEIGVMDLADQDGSPGGRRRWPAAMPAGRRRK